MIELADYGFSDFFTSDIEIPENRIPARIVETRRGRFMAVCRHGQVSAVLKGSCDVYPAIGDFVVLEYFDKGSSRIESVLERKSKFSRTNYSGHAVGYVKTIMEQVVAANFDYVFILCSMNNDFNVNRLDRYLALARRNGGTPVVVLTKADLCCESDAVEYENAALSAAGETSVHIVSSYTGYGLDALKPYLQPAKTVVFLGSSGVGKSSLVNALAGEELMSVKEIREDDSRGRHTTSHRQLIRMKNGVLVIDTPGMREIGLWDAVEGISEAFSDIEDLIARCRFSDCGHEKEPGCAVRSALESGELDHKRYANYLTLKNEAEFVKKRSAVRRKK